MSSTYIAKNGAAGSGAPLGQLNENGQSVGIVCTEGEGHRVVIGPPGSGKFTSVIAPLLLCADRASAVVFDVKNGEAATQTMRHRAKLGPAHVLDPFGVTGFAVDRLNPLDVLRTDDREILETARRLTEATFIAKDGGESQFWNDQARDLLTALMIHVATAPEEAGQRNLKRVREIIRRPLNLPQDPDNPTAAEQAAFDLILAMLNNHAAGGVVVAAAENIQAAAAADSEKLLFNIQQTLRANTSFLDLPTVQDSTEATDVDLSALRREVSTLYVVVPEYQLDTVSRWLRLIYVVIMEQMRRAASVQSPVPLHVVLDEFPALGKFERVQRDMNLVRSYRVHMHVIVQTLAQLEGLYGTGWQAFLAAAKFQQVLGANDQFTAEYVSKRLGTRKVAKRSTSHTRQASGASAGSSVTETDEPLMHPHEVAQLNPQTALVMIEGQKPLMVQKWHHYASHYLQDRMNATGGGWNAAGGQFFSVNAGR